MDTNLENVIKLSNMVSDLVKERDELKMALENLLQSFKKLDDGSYMELSSGLTQYNIKKAYDVLNKYSVIFIRE